jgi:hypothetical protein
MADIVGQGNEQPIHKDEIAELDQSYFTPLKELDSDEFAGIIADALAQEEHQDAIDDSVRPRGLRAKAAAADQNPSPKRLEWEIETFGKPLSAVTIGDLVKGLTSNTPDKRRACAEALKEESKSDLKVLEKQLLKATQDTDEYTAAYAQECLNKAEVEIITVPKP